ncbi:MAG: 50S ribosomal protein L25 [Chitinophagales bacterium]|nr:50S ribosomal protein L25 [Chitinophagales bacterium]
MKTITIEGQIRNTSGKAEIKSLRKSGQILCSISGGEKNVSFCAPATAFKDLVYTPEFYTATIKLDGKESTAVMQEIQFDPLTDEIQHIDFLELNEHKKLTVQLPITLEGTPVGTKEGGKINQRVKKLKVRLYPKDLMEHITVKIDHLELGKSIRISEMKMDGVEFLNAPHIPIVSVFVPRQVKEETPVAAAPVAAATPAAGTLAAPAAGAAPAPAAEKGGAKKEAKKK